MINPKKRLTRCGREVGPFIRGEAGRHNLKSNSRSPRWEKSAGKASWSEHQNGSRNRSHRRGEGRNMGTCAPYARREGFTPLMKTPKEILAMDNVNFPPPPPMIEEAVASGRLAHLVKDIRQGGQKGKGSAKGREKVINMVRSQGYRKRPYERVEHWMDMNKLSVRASISLMNCRGSGRLVIEGFRVKRIHVDGGEVSYPMGVIDLEVTMGECGKTRTVIMEFAVVKVSPFNALLGGSVRRVQDMPYYLTLRECGIFDSRLSRYDGVQKKRRLAPAGEEVVTDEVNEWLKADMTGCDIRDGWNSAFKEQIGVNLEAYVDNMVIKSRTEQDIIKDVEQTFFTLRRINMKLTHEERWTEAAEAAFLEMKKLCGAPHGKEREANAYTPMEKLALALVHAARRLRRYFQAHPIKVITDSPIGQVLNNSGASGRLAKWAVELGAYGITYVPRVAIKGQVLADFLADTPAEIRVLLRLPNKPKSGRTSQEPSTRGGYHGGDEEEGPTWYDPDPNTTWKEGKVTRRPVDARTLWKKLGKLYDRGWSTYIDKSLPGSAEEVCRFLCRPITFLEERCLEELIRACDDCQAHAAVPRLPKVMISVTSAWPFMKWGMDIVGPLPEGPGRVKFGIQDYHHQDNGTSSFVEMILSKSGRELRPDWRREDQLGLREVPMCCGWAIETMKKTSNGETPFSLTYGTEAVIPAEIGMPTHRTSSVNEKTNDQELRLNLNLLEERREIAAIREARAVTQAKLGHPPGKDPTKVIQAFQSVALQLSNMEGKEIPRPWHTCNLRRTCSGGDLSITDVLSSSSYSSSVKVSSLNGFLLFLQVLWSASVTKSPDDEVGVSRHDVLVPQGCVSEEG
ncbi:reverse transcriptase domain-containing protein [Tanacetum coccineum]